MVSKHRNMFHKNKKQETMEIVGLFYVINESTAHSIKSNEKFIRNSVQQQKDGKLHVPISVYKSKCQNMFYQNKKQETTEIENSVVLHLWRLAPALTASRVLDSSLLDAVQNISDGASLPSPATMAKRKAAASAETSPATPQVPVSNSFELLANTPEIVPDAPKKEFVPPIVLNGKPANITQFITDTRKVTEHDIRIRSTGRNAKIIVASRKDYQKVYDLYKERIVQFFSFAFKDDHLKRGTVIVAGDFNARHRLWHCIRKNANGAILYDFVMNRGATLFAPETPTYVPSHGKGSQSTLDLVLANSSRCISSISTLTEGGSDHLPVYFELWGTPQTQLKKPRFDFRRTDWDVFRCALNNVIPTARPPLGTATDIDTAVVTFTEEITAAVQASTPTSTPKPQKLELPEEILDLIRDKNKVHRRVEDKRAYNRLHKEVRSRISQWRFNRWDELLRNVSPQDNSLWKLTRRLNRQGLWTTPTLRTETTTATTDLEKAELLAQHFATINNNSVNRGDGSFNEKVEAEVRRLITGRTNSQTQDASEVGPHTISSSKHATPREIEKIIKKLKNNKSPGSDGIPNTVLEHFTRKALVKLTNITNAILKHAHYPTHWKTATVIALPKPGKPTTEPSSYRPISLLSSLAKVVDRIILNRLTDVGDKMRIIPDNQFGFRRNHATIHQLSRVVSHISGNMAKRKITAMVLLDSEKAFDTVWIEGLIQRLATYNFPSVHIDNKLNWNVHTKTTNKLALSKLGCNYCLFRSSEINSRHKLLLYKAIVRPTLTYGCQVWHTVAETHLQKLQITQNKCIRLASGQPIRTNTLELHKSLNIPTLKDFIGQLTDKFKLSLRDHPNVLTRNTHITSKAKWGPTRRNSGARRSTVI
ncbi:hypothetical protein AAG570_007832 [Ranatra chinensis]|uniref:Reverse transcriptase domain-containing protein n=1 Tax=Ranatra chinensis TaxID=642074 RepID=A0ABD0YD81_9HEMI